MELLLPIIPAFVLGAIGYLLREYIKWWFIPVLVFFVVLGYQLFLFYSKFSIPLGSSEVEIVVNPDIKSLLPGMFVTSLYFAALSLVFVLVGMGIDRYINRFLNQDIIRFIVVTYITLLLLQLWVEVFPWTLLVPLRFYYSFR